MVSLRWRLGSPVWAFCFFINSQALIHEGTACLSVTGRSVLFPLRFRFVRVVRPVHAGKAKLRGRMSSDVLIAGPPRCECPGVRCSFSHIFCFYSYEFKEFVVLLFAFFLFFVVFYRFLGNVFLFDSTVLDEHELQKHFVK